MKTMATVLAFTLTGFFALSTAWAQAYGDKEHAELAKALKDAKVSLQHGLTASAKEGKPISAKYEMEDGGDHAGRRSHACQSSGRSHGQGQALPRCGGL
jgi:hypothetical protein